MWAWLWDYYSPAEFFLGLTEISELPDVTPVIPRSPLSTSLLARYKSFCRPHMSPGP